MDSFAGDSRYVVRPERWFPRFTRSSSRSLWREHGPADQPTTLRLLAARL